MVVDEQGTFREDNFQKAVAALNDSQVDGKLGSNKGADGKVSVKDTKQVGPCHVSTLECLWALQGIPDRGWCQFSVRLIPRPWRQCWLYHTMRMGAAYDANGVMFTLACNTRLRSAYLLSIQGVSFTLTGHGLRLLQTGAHGHGTQL